MYNYESIVYKFIILYLIEKIKCFAKKNSPAKCFFRKIAIDTTALKW